MAIQILATAATLGFPVLVPAIPDASNTDVGIFLTVVYVGAMIGATASGGMVARLGPVRSSQIALVVQAVALALVATGSLPLRLLGALLIGIGYGPITPSSSQILARTTPADRLGFVFSVKQTGVPLGGLLAGVLLIPLATVSSWRFSMLALAGAALLVAIVCNPLHPMLDRPAARASSGAGARHALASILRHPGLRSIAAVSMLFAVCQLSLSGYLVVYLHEEVGLSLVDAGIVYAVSQAAGIAGRLIWGRLADATRSPNTVMLIISVLMGASALITGLFTPGWPVLAVWLVAAAFGATAIGWNGVFLGEVARLAPAGSVAAITGGVLTFTYIGVVVGPVLFGYVGDGLGSVGLAFMALAAVPAVVVALLLRLRRTRGD